MAPLERKLWLGKNRCVSIPTEFLEFVPRELQLRYRGIRSGVKSLEWNSWEEDKSLVPSLSVHYPSLRPEGINGLNPDHHEIRQGCAQSRGISAWRNVIQCNMLYSSRWFWVNFPPHSAFSNFKMICPSLDFQVHLIHYFTVHQVYSLSDMFWEWFIV